MHNTLPSIRLIMFYSSHFHRVLANTFFLFLLLLILSPQTSFSQRGRERERERTYSCSGKREQMSEAACAHIPALSGGNGNERSRHISPALNPSSGKGRADLLASWLAG